MCPEGEGRIGEEEYGRGVHLAIDYRYVNKFTISDAYPTPDLADIIQEVGNACYISTFYATKGYYQTPVREEDRWLTAFLCEFRLFELRSSLCDYAVAGVLAQQDDNGNDRPVAFASVNLSPSQRSWATIEKEAYTAIWALQMFKRWVFWSNMTIFSDHNPLIYLTQLLPAAPS